MELVSDNFGDVWFVFSTQQEICILDSPSIGAAQEHLSPLAWYTAFYHFTRNAFET